jgi:hypothetical protein
VFGPERSLTSVRPPPYHNTPFRKNTRTSRSSSLPETRSYGVAEGVATGEFCAAALAEETGVADTSGVADEIGLTDTSGLAVASGTADDCGVTLAAGVLAALAVALGKAVVGLGTALVFGATVAVGAGFVFFSSFSRRPVLRCELCLAVKIVRRRVTPKNIPPR